MPDFLVENHGSIFVFQPMNADARKHLEENVQAGAQWWAGGLVVEHRYARDLAEALLDEGFKVQ